MKLDITALPGGFGSSVKIDGKEFNYCVENIEIAKMKSTEDRNIIPSVTITFIPDQLSLDCKALELFCPCSKKEHGKPGDSSIDKGNCC